MTTPNYLAAELARQVHDADQDFYAGRISYAFFELRRRGLWLLAAREQLTADTRRELVMLEVSRDC